MPLSFARAASSALKDSGSSHFSRSSRRECALSASGENSSRILNCWNLTAAQPTSAARSTKARARSRSRRWLLETSATKRVLTAATSGLLRQPASRTAVPIGTDGETEVVERSAWTVGLVHLGERELEAHEALRTASLAGHERQRGSFLLGPAHLEAEPTVVDRDPTIGSAERGRGADQGRHTLRVVATVVEPQAFARTAVGAVHPQLVP